MFNEGYNVVELLGSIISGPVFTHRLGEERFYQMKLGVKRQSGIMDILPITFMDKNAPQALKPGDMVRLSGQLRSYNKQEQGRNRLLLCVFAREMIKVKEPIEDRNKIELAGCICRQPTFRTTPFAREISDLFIAVKRSSQRCDYLPLIAWGRAARYAACLNVGDTIRIIGRIQSREYQKQTEAGLVTRTAYEVSISSLARLPS